MSSSTKIYAKIGGR